MSDRLIIVPARGESKRLPGKNLNLLAGQSLLAHTAQAIVAAGLVDMVLLSTDSEKIAEEGRRLGWSVPFLRPANLARDDSPTIDAITHALDWHEAETSRDPCEVMVLQPTSPLRGGACLKAAVKVLEQYHSVDSVIGMKALDIAPARLYFAGTAASCEPVVQGDGRRPVYVPNGAVYLTRTVALRRAKSLYAGTIYPLAMSELRSIDVDTEYDWRIAEAVIAAGLPPDNADHAPVAATHGSIA